MSRSFFACILAMAAAHSVAHAVQDSAALRLVTPGEIVEGHISGGETAHYSLVLTAGQFATILVAHRNIDVVTRAREPDAPEGVEASSDGPDGELRLPLVASGSAPILIEVAATYPKSPGGTYTVRIENVRVATGNDRRAADAERHRSRAVQLRETDDYASAVTHAREGLALTEKAFGASAPEVARSLLLLGQLEDARANFGLADSFLARARAVVEHTAGQNDLLAAQILDARAASLITRGNFAEAEPLVRETLASRERIAGRFHFLVAASLGTLADLHDASANVQEAAAVAERAAGIAARWYRPEDVVFGDFLNRIARSQLMLGNYARAEQLYREALEARERTAGADSLAVAQSLAGLARVSLLSNDNVPAEERYLRALAIRERVLGPDHPQVASDVFNLGLISYRRRDFTSALARYHRALDIRQKTFGHFHPQIALTLNNLGLVYWRQQDYGRAEKFFGDALELSEGLYGADSLRVTNSLGNLGIVAKETGHYALAEARYQRALAIKEKHLGPDHPELIALVESLAILYRDRGEYRHAEQMLERTIRLTTASLGPDHPFVARHLSNLAQLHWAAGDWEQALAARARVVAIEERNLPLELALGSERQKLAYFEPLLSDLERIITLHVRLPRENPAARDLALTTLLQRKGRVFDALADNISAFRQRSNPEDRELLDRLSRVTSALAAAALSDSTESSMAERQRRIARLASEREQLEVEVQRRSAGYLSPSRPLTLAEVQHAVPADAALIEFSRYRPFDPRMPVENDQQFGPPHYVAYVVRPGGDAHWKDLGAADAIDSAVERFRSALADASRRDVGRLSTELHRLLIAPLEPLLGDGTHLLISPDGALNLIPFEALESARGRYLVEDHLISYLTTGRDLVRMLTPRPAAGPSVVFADPAFGDPLERPPARSRAVAARNRRSLLTGDDTSPMYFGRLPGTAGEAQRILAILPGARLRSGRDATEEALKNLHAPRILHIATHGFFLPDQNVENRSGGRGATRPAAGRARVDNPLLRSGLALAGANRSHSRSEEDGILTALEAANLHLWGTKLVTLSACDTGVGVVRNGEGVYGFRRAVFLAGAESLVMSLWPVSDAITREMMAGYYAGLEKGLGRGAALRRMQLRMLKRPGRAHPFYWASFIQGGEWAPLDGRR